jgi:hypothetical protein
MKKVGQGDDYSRTGFAISPVLFVTNNHCISAAEQVLSAGARYNYEVDNQGAPLEVGFAELITTNSLYDYSLLRLVTPLSTEYVAHLLLTTLVAPVPDIIQIQHPAGGRKKIAAPCKLQTLDASDVADGIAVGFLNSIFTMFSSAWQTIPSAASTSCCLGT